MAAGQEIRAVRRGARPSTAAWLAECWLDILGVRRPTGRLLRRGRHQPRRGPAGRPRCGPATRRSPWATSTITRRWPSSPDTCPRSTPPEIVTTDRIVTPMPRGAAVLQAVLTRAAADASARCAGCVGLAALNNLLRLPALGADRLVVVGAAGLAAVRLPRRADRAGRGAAPGCCCAARAGHLPARRRACTCGCGSPSSSPNGSACDRLSPARLAHPLRPGARRAGRRATPTCTRAPPITGMLKLGRARAVEPEVDLSGYWIDGDRVHIGEIRIGAGATIGARSTLFPGARIGKNAQIAAGLGGGGRGAVRRALGRLARRPDRARPRAARRASGRRARARWVASTASSALVLGLMPAGRRAARPRRAPASTARRPLRATSCARCCRSRTVASMATLRAADRWPWCGCWPSACTRGYHPVHSRQAWQAWATERLMAMARVWLFPLYASMFTPVWLRAAGHEGRPGRGGCRRCWRCRR